MNGASRVFILIQSVRTQKKPKGKKRRSQKTGDTLNCHQKEHFKTITNQTKYIIVAPTNKRNVAIFTHSVHTHTKKRIRRKDTKETICTRFWHHVWWIIQICRKLTVMSPFFSPFANLLRLNEATENKKIHSSFSNYRQQLFPERFLHLRKSRTPRTSTRTSLDL